MKHIITGLLLLFAFSGFGQKDKQYQAKGDSMQQRYDFEKAIKYYDSAIKLNPKVEMYYRSRGYSYFALGKTAEARRDYNSALKINPGCLRCQYNLISITGTENKMDEALKLADSVINAYKDTGINSAILLDIKLLKGEIYIYQGDEMEAEALYDELVRQYPDSAEVHYGKALFNLNHGSKKEALASINKCISLDNKNADYYFVKGDIYLRVEAYKEALPPMELAIKYDSTNAKYYAYKAGIKVYFKEADEAIALYKKAIELDSANWIYYAQLSSAYHQKEDMDSECLVIKKSIALLEKDTSSPDYKTYHQHNIDYSNEFCDPKRASYYYQRGVALYNLKLYDSAVAYYTYGLKKFPGHPIILSFRGNAYLVLEQFDKAEKDYIAALADRKYLLAAAKEKYENVAESEMLKYYNGLISSSYFSLAEVYLTQQEYKKALAAVDSAIQVAPNMKEMPLYIYYNHRGRIYLAMGDNENAAKDFEYVIRMAELDPTGYINMAIAKANIALETPDKFMRFSVSATGMMNNASYTSPEIQLTNRQQQLLQDAIGYADKAIGLYTDAPAYYIIRGNIKKLAGHPSACDDFREAKKKGMNEADSYIIMNCK